MDVTKAERTSSLPPDGLFPGLVSDNADLNTMIGELSRILGRYTSGTQQDDGERELFRRVQYQIRCLQQEFTGMLSTNGGINRSAVLLEKFLSALLSHNSQMDPVLKYCLVRVSCVDKQIWQALEKHAICQMATSFEEYVSVMGKLLPVDFVDASKLATTCRRYARDEQVAGHDWPIFLDRLRTWGKEHQPGITTGLKPVDQVLGGGLKGLTFLGGPPGVGKTTFALSIAAAALKENQNLVVVFLSLDMTKDQIYARLLSSNTGIPYTELVSRPLDENRAKAQGVALCDEVLNRLRVVTSLPSQGLTAQWLALLCNETLNQTKAGQRVMIVVDHFQRLNVDFGDLADLEADKALLDVFDQFQASTRTPDNPHGDIFLVISQIRKDAGTTGLEVADLLGSADLGYRASCVMMLEHSSRDIRRDDIAPLTLKIVKGRDGVSRTSIQLDFQHPVSQFKMPGEILTAKTTTPTTVGIKPFAGPKRS